LKKDFSFFSKNIALSALLFLKNYLPLRAKFRLSAGNVQPLHRCAGDPRCSI